ncbi:MAG TPA: VCBS repeat-containing protein [Pyrinomonadaceae bacterium]|nr:VCBS repeat-containing protein [Pyrinomonadaceae bacterium]
MSARSSLLSAILVLLLGFNGAFASAVIRVGAGANPAAIQAAVDQFRADLGGVNNGVGGSFPTGRREINWDGVPDNASEPNPLVYNFFNVNSPRGVIFHSIANIGGNHQFRVSASAASGTAVRFGNIDASYSSIFQTFTSEKIFQARFAHEIEILFFVPGTTIPATVSGFGAVFCDVDSSNTFIEYYATDGNKISGSSLNVANNGLSFIGTSFNAGERVAKVIIRLGNANIQSGNIDGTNGVDVVAMDDFIYGEPRAMQFHSGDFDGDGIADSAIFRPTTGQWFTFNSGSNTFSIVRWGVNGDQPVDGDFDGDSKADQAIFRPSDGSWWIRKSSDLGTLVLTFGTNGDRPVAGDYDKDGKTDVAVWRPSNGHFFIARSSTNFSTFFGYPFGQNGDIPVQAAAH